MSQFDLTWFYDVIIRQGWKVLWGAAIRDQKVMFLSSHFYEVLPAKRNSHRRCSVKKVVLKSFAKFTGQYLYHSLFFNRDADLSLSTSVFQQIFQRKYLQWQLLHIRKYPLICSHHLTVKLKKSFQGCLFYVSLRTKAVLITPDQVFFLFSTLNFVLNSLRITYNFYIQIFIIRLGKIFIL